MRLDIARLCLDCNEVHDAERCVVCGSEAFAYLTRWIPTTEQRTLPRPTTSPEADVYRKLIAPERTPKRGRLLTGSALGVTAVAAVVGWLWRSSQGRSEGETLDVERSGGNDNSGRRD
jgi:hypothetical protein